MIKINQSKAYPKGSVQVFGYEENTTETSASGSCDNNTISISTNVTIDKGTLNGYDVLSVSEFAREISVTSQAVRKMIGEGRVRAMKIGEQYVIDKGELMKYLNGKK